MDVELLFGELCEDGCWMLCDGDDDALFDQGKECVSVVCCG